MADLEFALKYPFSESGKLFLANMQLNERIVELGMERIKKALGGQSTARMLLHEGDKKEEVASFAAARMILGSLRNDYLTNRFAVNESKIVRGHLDREDDGGVNQVAGLFGIVTQGEGSRMRVDLPTYLKYSVRAPHYRLINRRLFNGMVEINQDEKKRLVEEAVKRHISNIPLVKDPPAIVKEAGKKLLAEIPKTETRIIINAEDHPPCITKLLEDAKKHTNLPHHARWYLASYFLALGKNEDEIAKMFTMMPDFNEKVTKYQVSHIKKKGYNVPSCATIMTYGLCCAVCRIGNPLNWHSLTKERREAIGK